MSNFLKNRIFIRDIRDAVYSSVINRVILSDVSYTVLKIDYFLSEDREA